METKTHLEKLREAYKFNQRDHAEIDEIVEAISKDNKKLSEDLQKFILTFDTKQERNAVSWAFNKFSEEFEQLLKGEGE